MRGNYSVEELGKRERVAIRMPLWPGENVPGDGIRLIRMSTGKISITLGRNIIGTISRGKGNNTPNLSIMAISNKIGKMALNTQNVKNVTHERHQNGGLVQTGQEGGGQPRTEVKNERDEQARTTIKKKQFIDTLRESIGIVRIACDAVQISRQTYYRWYDDDPEFRAEVEQIRKEQLGEVEDRLIKAIAREDPGSIRFYLSRVHPKYRPKQENYIVPTEKTLEDLLDDYKKDENTPGQQNTDRETPENQGQEGKPGAVQTEPGPGILPSQENAPKPDPESKAERDQ
jgi:hypothetical protein